MNKWIFVIDTDSYAGNFERDMCAYITGVLGDCEVGDEFAKIYLKETGEEESQFTEILEQRPDEHGCCRPCSCWETKGWLWDGGDGAVREEDWDQAKSDEKHRKSSAKIYQGYYDMYAKYDPKDPSVIRAGWTEKSLKSQLKRSQKEIDKCDKLICHKVSPNNSVAIFFEEKPTEKMISIMKFRAAKFAQAKRDTGDTWDKNFKLTICGFRLIKETTEMQEEET